MRASFLFFSLLVTASSACTARSNGSPPPPEDSGPPPADTSVLDTGAVMDAPPTDTGAAVDVAPAPDVTAAPDTAPGDCRMAACPAGNYCDLGTGRCLPGCAFDEQCPQPGRCNVASHACECGAGQHACGNACVMNDSTATCGTRCEPCPTATNATTACTGGACQLTCNAGYHTCNGACASNSDVATCGTRCTPCPTASGGTAACVAGECVLRCDSGRHVCGGACVPDNDPATCGTRCTPCPTGSNGTASCVGGACVFECNAGYHACGGACVRDDDVTRCGAACVTCPTAAGARTACEAGRCVVGCASGQHVCNGVCVSETSPAACGTSCTVCPAMPNAAATCVSGACGFTCNAGYHTCNGACVSDNDPATCGTRCAPCTSGPNAVATCTAGVCGSVCASGATDCGDGCVNLMTSSAHCGACGRACVLGLTCESGTCNTPCTVGATFRGGFALPGLVSGNVRAGTNLLAVADFNNDRDLDVVALATDGYSAWVYLYNPATMEFRPRNSYSMPGGMTADSVTTGDVNEDGRADIILLGRPPGSRIGLLLSTGTGFNPVTINGTGASWISVTTGDFNRDRHLDLYVGTGSPYTGSGSGPPGARLLVGRGDGTFTERAADSFGTTGFGPHAVQAADMTGDGILDVVTTATDLLFLQVRIGNGDGTFRAGSTVSTRYITVQLRVADVDRNGVPDIVTVNPGAGDPGCAQGIGVVLSNVDSTLRRPVCIESAGGMHTLTVADFNGDSNPDIVTGSTNGSVMPLSLLAGDGRGGFSPATTVWPTGPYAITTGDFQRDGRTDLAFIEAAVGTTAVRLLYNFCR